MYTDFEEYLNLFKYDCFLYVVMLHLDPRFLPMAEIQSLAAQYNIQQINK